MLKIFGTEVCRLVKFTIEEEGLQLLGKVHIYLLLISKYLHKCLSLLSVQFSIKNCRNSCESSE